ncbi:hypothetical protein [uncultured Photobacterium sp.]|uniref:hypothetical protein n=1 Tax=uncultured Photobacterium sp. TaxID=173973 RepID=UPI002616E2C9|nr:hypothetical protein [uncultured Photobacterium sp.]
MNRYNNIILYIAFISLLLTPAFILPGGIQMAQKVYFVLEGGVLLSIFIVYISIIKEYKIPNCNIFCIMFLLTTIIIISNLFNNALLNGSSLLATIRYPLYFFIVLLFYNLSRIADYYKIEKLCVYFFIITSVFTIFQCFSIFEPFVKLYTDGYNSFLGLRVNSIFRYSYLYAVFINFFIGFFFAIYIRDKQKRHLLYILVLFIFLLLTQSKTAYLSLFFTISILLLLYLINENIDISSKLFVSTAIIIFSCVIIYILFVFFSDKISHVLNFINYINGTAGIDGSTQTRLTQFNTTKYLIDQMGSDILFGLGSNGSGSIILENAYLDYVVSYGILGLLCYVCLIFYFIFMGGGDFRKLLTSYTSPFTIGFLCMSVSLLILAFSSSPTDAYRSSFIIYALVGVRIYIGVECKK